MSGLEALAIVACVAGIVSAFHGGAELSEIIKDRKQKRKKKKNDQEIARQVAQQEILRDSLLAGGQLVDTTSYERRRDFGLAFERGDQIAEIELMRVVMNLQGEVIRALQMAKDIENASLNMTRLYEFSIINRQAAVNSMDQLCQRILQSAPVERNIDAPSSTSPLGNLSPLNLVLPTLDLRSMNRRSSDESLRSFLVSPTTDLPAAVVVTGPLHTPALGSSAASALTRNNSNASFLRSFSWMRGQVRASDSDTIRTGRIVEEETESVSPLTPSYLAPPSSRNHLTRSYRQSSVPQTSTSPLGPIVMHERSQSASDTTPASPSRYLSSPSTENRTPSLSSNSSYNPRTHSSRTASVGSGEPSNGLIPVLSDPESRATAAPEVVTHETTPRQWHAPFGYADPQNFSGSIQVMSPLVKSASLDPWAPLQQPSKSNHFHGYCEGTWCSRPYALSGLMLVQKPFGLMTNVPHWKCRKCQFCARSTSTNKERIPRDITTCANGIRYRWLFLARSHLKSSDASGRRDGYKYGCIMCTAEGVKDVASYGQIDALMDHILNAHGNRMSSEIKDRTRAITGRIADATEEWDINIP